MQDNQKQGLNVVTYTGIAAVLMLLACTAIFGVYPMVREGLNHIQATTERKSTLARFNGLSETLAQVEDARKETEHRLEDVEKRLPSSLEASKFNAELSEVAKNAGIRIESMPRPGMPKESGGYKALPVSIVGKGDWESCYKFLIGIKGMNRLTRLDSVVLEMEEKDGKTPTWDKPTCLITVNFSTFFMER